MRYVIKYRFFVGFLTLSDKNNIEDEVRKLESKWVKVDNVCFGMTNEIHLLSDEFTSHQVRALQEKLDDIEQITSIKFLEIKQN